MTPFEYVTVLISILLGLGITQIVTGIADIIHAWERVTLYWPHLLWIILVFFLQIQEWWLIYQLRTYSSWHLPVFFLMSLYPISLFILSRILFPISIGSSAIHFKGFYFDNYRKYFVMIVLCILLSILENIIIHGYSFSQQLIQFALLATMITLTLAKPRAEWIHKLVVSSLVLLMTASLILTWNLWQISS